MTSMEKIYILEVNGKQIMRYTLTFLLSKSIKNKFLFEKIITGTRTYIPDFKIYHFDDSFEYHEVKGWLDSKSKTKLKRMKKYFPQIKMILIDKEAYYDIKKKVGKLLKFY